jgi:hypothetical protein
VKGFLASLCGLAALSCAQAHRGGGIPDGTGPLIAIYKATIDDGQGSARSVKLAVWAERPGRLHAELIAPLGGLSYILDAGEGRVCIVDVSGGVAYVGQDDPAAMLALTGVRVSVAATVEALLDGASPAGLTVTREGADDGEFPTRLRISDETRALALERIRFERGHADAASLGTGAPPGNLRIEPLANLGENMARKEGSAGDRR